jgi:hypothetical protein
VSYFAIDRGGPNLLLKYQRGRLRVRFEGLVFFLLTKGIDLKFYLT